MRITRTKKFEKRYKKLPPKLRARVRERVILFSKEPFHPDLENHALGGKYLGCQSISVTGDYRVIYEEIAPVLVRLLICGTHHELYGT